MNIFCRAVCRRSWLGALIFCGVVLAAGCATRADEGAIIGLDEIKPGQKGFWRTAVQGNKIEEFRLEVVGVLQNYIGPEHPIIVCRALDESQRASGPVQGMSGSPVYIDGRLAGAYAYGWPWSKNETLIGVTPIELMMPLYDLPDRPARPEKAMGAGGEVPEEAMAWWFDPAQAGGLQAGLTGGEGRATRLFAAPAPLFVSGVSPAVYESFGDDLRNFGLEAIPLGAGAGGGVAEFAGFEPGSPIGLVLSSGDIVFGGVGTVTHVQGDRLLAYGHASSKTGSIELPMAPAEVVTIAQRQDISFKLTNMGQPVGTIWQDQAAGISGQVGRIPYMSPIRVSLAGDFPVETRGAVAELPDRSAGIFFAYMAQTLLRSPGGLDLATVTGDLRVEFAGVAEPLQMRYRGVGFAGARLLLLRFASVVGRILQAPMEKPRVEALEAHFEVSPGRNTWQLLSLRLLTSRPQAGGVVQVALLLQPELGPAEQRMVEVPLPEGTRGEQLAVVVQDQGQAESFDGWGERRVYSSFGSLLEELNLLRPNDRIYLRLLRERPALKIDGRVMEDLPPSVISLYRQSLEAAGGQVRASVVWEDALPVAGTFSGQGRVEFVVE